MKIRTKPKAVIRKPGDVAKFVEQGDSRPLASAPPEQSGSVARRGLVSRVRKGDLDRVTAYLPVDMGIQLRRACVDKRIELSEAIADALRPWLEKQAR